MARLRASRRLRARAKASRRLLARAKAVQGRQSVAIEVLHRSLLLQSAEQSKRLLLEKVARRVLRRGLLLQSAVTGVLR